MTQLKTLLNSLQKAATYVLECMVESRQRQVQAYLARSVDMADLEKRMRETNRIGVHTPRY
jgi:hypothetical protein